MISKWGKETDINNVLSEYPRPSMVRDGYISLNGVWEYAISRREKVDIYDGEILVPFSPESYLSGVKRILQPYEYLHYKKVFTIPEGFKKSGILLHFGAVDQECRVYVNGVYEGVHKGGYLPFSFDITNELKDGENIITLTVADRTEKLPYARGKQRLKTTGRLASIFYTPQSGIWQSVWLESVESVYVRELKITPDYDNKKVILRVERGFAGKKAVFHVENGFNIYGNIQAKNEPRKNSKKDDTYNTEVIDELSIEIYDKGIKKASKGGKPGEDIEIDLEDFKPWSPENPYLYDVSVRLGDDIVRSYFGMRKFDIQNDGKGILRFFLNNKPYFFNGVLDQGYWPESLMTPPSDNAFISDIQSMKSLGYNTIRKHVKIEFERFYYHCDRLGMIVWQDMPNGGGDYNMYFVSYMPNIFGNLVRNIKDNFYTLFKRRSRAGRKLYYKELRGMIRHLYNFTCIAAWVPFNEGWGQFDAGKACELIKKLDKTRFINEACGWFDQGGGDMYSIHNYFRKLLIKKPQKDRVTVLSECGGYACPVKDHIFDEEIYGYRYYESGAELTDNYIRLFKEEIISNIKNGLSAAVYTQLSDIQKEVNGILTYDREKLKLDKERALEIHNALYEEFSRVT